MWFVVTGAWDGPRGGPTGQKPGLLTSSQAGPRALPPSWDTGVSSVILGLRE